MINLQVLGLLYEHNYRLDVDKAVGKEDKEKHTCIREVVSSFIYVSSKEWFLNTKHKLISNQLGRKISRYTRQMAQECRNIA